jgi:glycosyltransferase involved in cell wall biosynthesis
VAKYGNTIVEPVVIPVRVERTMPPKAPLPKHFTYSLITVGRLEPEKRIEDIISAVARIVLKYPFLGLFIVGEGRERKRLERMVAKLGIGEHVIFTGYRTDAYGLMQSAQAFIQASAYEGYGRTLVEAALAKVPIITTDVGIVGEVFTGYEDVLAAPVADPTTLSYHIVGLINDENVRLEYPRSAYKKAEAHLASAMNSPADIAADLAKALIK